MAPTRFALTALAAAALAGCGARDDDAPRHAWRAGKADGDAVAAHERELRERTDVVWTDRRRDERGWYLIVVPSPRSSEAVGERMRDLGYEPIGKEDESAR